MTVAVILGVVAAVGLLFTYCLIRALLDIGEKARTQHVRDRALHNEQIARLVEDMAGERREWGQERAVLLNRIQDPTAGVVSSMAYMPTPEPGALDVDLAR